MPTVHLDKVQGSQFTSSGQDETYVRPGWVSDIEISNEPGGTDAMALVRLKNLPDMPKYGSALSPEYPYMRMSELRVIPSPNTFRRVDFHLVYTTGPILETTFIIRDNSFDGSATLSYIPGINKPVEVAWQDPPPDHPGDRPDPNVAVGSPAKKPTTYEVLPMQYPRAITHRTISVTVLRYGVPQQTSAGNNLLIPPQAILGMGLDPVFGKDGATPGSAHDYVNDAPWPTDYYPPLPAGYWRIVQFNTDTSVYEGYHTVTTTAATRTIMDWSESERYRSPITGQPVTIPDNVLQHAMNQPYVFEVISMVNGMTRIGPYPMTNFYNLFGF